MPARTTRKCGIARGRRAARGSRSSDTGDFYDALNRDWLRRTRLPDTETRITQAYFINTEIRRELAGVISAELESGRNRALCDLYASWCAAEREVIPRGLTPLLHTMLAATTPADISARIGWLNRHGIPAPLLVYVQGDPRDHRRCRVFIEEGSPNIGIPEYWLWPEYAEHRRMYAAYVRRLSAQLALPQLLEGLPAEREMARIYPPARTSERPTNLLTWSELRRTYTVIDWSALLREWGLTEAEMPRLMYNVTSPAYVHHIQSRLRRWSPERWSGWMALLVTQWLAGISPAGPLRDAWFAYKRRFLQGMPRDESPHELRFAILRALLPNVLGKLWVRDHCSAALRRNVGAMTERIRDAAIEQVGATPWLSPSTRAAAAKKLRAMDVQVCWPERDVWESPEETCALQPEDYVANLLALFATGTDRSMARLAIRGGRGCRRSANNGNGWGKPVYEVNAFYYPDENRFLLPAAILRPPFYDPTKSLAWNYGGIGATIGHEFCHAFDADGRSYDEHGDKRDWWTEHDDREYKKRAAEVVRLYESRRYRGMKVNGRLTLVENIADLGGLEFALAGLRASLGRALTKDEKREFFTSFAISWRSKDRRRRAAELLATDPHSPPALRVAHAVRQFDEWYEAFDVGPDCPGYIPPAQRIRFFR